MGLIFHYSFTLLLRKMQAVCRHAGFIKLISFEDISREKVIIWGSFLTNTCFCKTPFTGYLTFGSCFDIGNAECLKKRTIIVAQKDIEREALEKKTSQKHDLINHFFSFSLSFFCAVC